MESIVTPVLPDSDPAMLTDPGGLSLCLQQTYMNKFDLGFGLSRRSVMQRYAYI